jgi:predicted Zn finger-like uncharacterized protein
MRFNCQSCSAKYQIADEKVAGKTVRMKCRKCGALIQVRAGEGGEATHVDASARASIPPASAVPTSLEAATGVLQKPAGLTPPGAQPASPVTAALRPDAMRTTMRSAGQPPKVSGPAAAPVPRAPLPSRPSEPGRSPVAPGASAPPRPAGLPPRPGSPITKLSSPVAAPLPAQHGNEDESTMVMQRPDQDLIEAAKAKRAAALVAAAPAPTAAPSPAKDVAEWYVGIDGQPVGPVNKQFIADSVAKGKVTRETLIWKEELTDWKAIKLFPEMSDLFVAERTSVPTSSGPVVSERAPAAQISDPVALTRVKQEVPASPEVARDPLAGFDDKPQVLADDAGTVQMGPENEAVAAVKAAAAQALEERKANEARQAAEAQAEAERAALEAADRPAKDEAERAAKAEAERAAKDAAERAAKEEAEHAAKAEAERAAKATEAKAADDEAARAELKGASSAAAATSAMTSAVPSGSGRTPSLAPDVPGLSTRSDPPSSESLAELAGISTGRERRKKSRGLHPMVYAFIAMCAGFGGVAAWVLLSPKSPPTAQNDAAGSTTKPTSSSEAASKLSSAPADSSQAVELGGVEVNSDGQPKSGTQTAKVNTSASPAQSASAKAVASAAQCDPKTDPLCSSVGGPESGPSNNGQTDSASGLTPEQAQAVVSRSQAGVARGCLPLVTSGSAKVTVTLTIAPSGSVSAVSASGGSGNPAVVSCVTSKVRGWRFPQSGATSQVTVPFTLIAQQ